MDTRIYVIAHKEFTKPADNIYIPLHAGSALGSDIGFERDDSGENISSKNRNYCELTGLYWIWKNVSCDIVGICHYRRYFVRDEAFLEKEYIENLLKDYDIILPHSAETEHGSNRDHYKNVHIIKDMEVCREVLSERFPDYLPAFDHFMDTNLASLANMIITKKEIFDEYCGFLFSVLFEIEKRVDITSYDEYQSRIFGFISERLLRVWIFMHSYRVAEEEVRMIDPQDADNASRVMALKHRMFELILQNLTEAYQNGKAYDVVDNSPLDIDLGGKVPIWICWWQGIDNAPDIVKLCVESVRRNIPSDKACIHIITFDNLGEYIALPTWIIEKFDKGFISYTHLSDILRAALLYRYGGLWIDATYYMVRPLPEKVFDKDDFYTIKRRTPFYKTDITDSKWACNLMRIGAGNVLFRYVLNGFYEYFEVKDEVIEYFFIDHLIALAYENLPEVKKMIDNCPYSQPQVLELAEMMNNRYSVAEFESLSSDTDVFKLSYKTDLYENTLLGHTTFYGYLVNKEKNNG